MSFAGIRGTIILIVLGVLVACGTWLYSDWKYQKSENLRQTENNRQLRMADSLNYVQQILSKEEIIHYLDFQNTDLKKNLEASNIRLGRIESIVASTYKYKDDATRSTDLSKLLDAIRENRSLSAPFSDSTKCLQIKGVVRFVNDSLKVDILSREFSNKSDAVVYWERRQWNFLGIKTRVFGKKQFTSTSFDQCGETKTLRIEKKK